MDRAEWILRQFFGPSRSPTPREVLGLSPDGDVLEDWDKIRGAYRDIAKSCHPDVTDDPYRHHLFQAAKAAYESLRKLKRSEEKPHPIEKFVAENPGCTSTAIYEGVDSAKRRTVRFLQRKGKIENRGTPHRHAWHVVEEGE